jgi:hypothetical protein
MLIPLLFCLLDEWRRNVGIMIIIFSPLSSNSRDSAVFFFVEKVCMKPNNYVRFEVQYYGWFGQSVGWRTSTGAPYMTVSV